MKGFFLLIISVGLVISSVVLLDLLLPKKEIQCSIAGIYQGKERGYRKYGRNGGKHLTHFKIKLCDGKFLFPIYKDDFSSFKEDDSVVLKKSLLLEQPLKLTILASGFTTGPALGLYSYFLVIPLAMFALCFYGIANRSRDDLVYTVGVFTVPLLGITLYLLL
jgi:hypothetical protein